MQDETKRDLRSLLAEIECLFEVEGDPDTQEDITFDEDSLADRLRDLLDHLSQNLQDQENLVKDLESLWEELEEAS